MSRFLKLLGLLVMIIGVIAGVYTTVWWAWIGGIVQAIEGAKMTPVDSWELAIGIVRVIFGSALGWIVGILVFSLGGFIAAVGDDMVIKRHRHWR